MPPTDALSTRVTVVQGAKLATKGTMWAILFGVCIASGYTIVTHLWPTGTSPSAVFDDSLKIVQVNSDVINMLGTPIKGYGEDRGRNQGRRNFISNQEFKKGDITHCRVTYNLEGPSGKRAVVFAEKTSAQGSGDFIYLIVQDPKTETIIPIIDNREVVPIDPRQKVLVDKMNEKNVVLYAGDDKLVLPLFTCPFCYT